MREAREHAPGEISAGRSDHSGGGELGRGDNSAMAGDEGVDMWHNCVRGSGARGLGRLGSREAADQPRHCVAMHFQMSCTLASRRATCTQPGPSPKKTKSKPKQYNSIGIKPNEMGILKKLVRVKHEPKQQNSVEKKPNGPGLPRKTTESKKSRRKSKHSCSVRL